MPSLKPGPRVEHTDEARPCAPTDLEGLFHAHARLVWRWAARLAGPHDDADDIVQDVFVIVHRHLPKLLALCDQPHLVRAWLFRTTSLVVRSRKRRDRVRNWLAGLAGDYAADVEAPNGSPLPFVERREAVGKVYAALDRLPEKFRTVLILHELEELSGEEIASLTGVRAATVFVHLHRARAHFLKAYQELEAGARKP